MNIDFSFAILICFGYNERYDAIEGGKPVISRKDRHAAKKIRNKQRTIRYLNLFLIAVLAVAAIAFLLNEWPETENSTGGSDNRSGIIEQENRSEDDDSDNKSNGSENQSQQGDSSDQDDGEDEPMGQEEPIIEDGDDQSNPLDPEATVSFSFVGDTMMAGNVAKLVNEHGFDYPFLHVKELLQAADFTIANLETPLTERGEPEEKTYAYRTSPKALPAIMDAGIDLVNIANNHILDYGHIGFYDTLDFLQEAGLPYVGGGRNVEEAFEPVVLEKNGISIAFLGFSRVVPEGWWKAGQDHPGVAETYDHRMPVEAIEKAAESADLVVVIAHWGIERESQPDDKQTELAHRYIDAGADLVVGSHPHVLQGAEQYKGKWIFYSLGNFIFTTNNNEMTWESVILNANCTKEGACDLQVVPILNKWAQPKPLEGDAAAKLLNRLSRISINAVVDEEDGAIRPE